MQFCELKTGATEPVLPALLSFQAPPLAVLGEEMPDSLTVSRAKKTERTVKLTQKLKEKTQLPNHQHKNQKKTDVKVCTHQDIHELLSKQNRMKAAFTQNIHFRNNTRQSTSNIDLYFKKQEPHTFECDSKPPLPLVPTHCW